MIDEVGEEKTYEEDRTIEERGKEKGGLEGDRRKSNSGIWRGGGEEGGGGRGMLLNEQRVGRRRQICAAKTEGGEEERAREK